MTLKFIAGLCNTFSHFNLTSPEDLWALVRTKAGMALEAEASVSVYIDDGRLLADCICHNGIPVSHEWAVAGCIACGRVYNSTTLIFPEDLAGLDAALGIRPPQDRDFYPHRGDTLAGVLAENNSKGYK